MERDIEIWSNMQTLNNNVQGWIWATSLKKQKVTSETYVTDKGMKSSDFSFFIHLTLGTPPLLHVTKNNTSMLLVSKEKQLCPIA